MNNTQKDLRCHFDAEINTHDKTMDETIIS